jgi:hypothetical protein
MTVPGLVTVLHLQDDDDDLFEDEEDFEREEHDDDEDENDDEDEDEEDEDAEDGTWYVQPDRAATRRTLTSGCEVFTLAPF